MKFLAFTARLLLFLALVFVFMVLFQYGTGGFVAGARSEAEWVRSLLPISSGSANMTESPPAGATEAGSNP